MRKQREQQAKQRTTTNSKIHKKIKMFQSINNQ
jgi:hypothetical protein